ncbi:hypothetical protein BCR35DRAFT_303582 [Leucosporidium creatinivorum]|uniref:NADH:flavin oxidoreductase/NADH oxidase N-terminal domain-containing protein n=1 Tax=Leucosporidium creatinivorum TaxID=106004 RepID=A0A1Y2FG76_9BASI|nr:hypothetical protein BCR35DRAFT_303582 [Leucosporidium creatinivorum]
MPSAAPTLWSPFKIGPIELKHRIVMAPLTRNRATKNDKAERTWVPNDLMCEYYSERATDGGLLISEAVPVSLVASGMLGVAGMWLPEQVQGWKKVTDSIHAKGGKVFAQLWHQGRNSHSTVSGVQPVSSSDVPITDSPHAWAGLPTEPFEVPHALTVEEIAATQDDFARCALAAVTEAGFDGVEIHAANGYIFDQFHHSNINTRTDQYGGSIEGRTLFTRETIAKISAAIGADRLGVRLAPFGYFNQTRGEHRVEQCTWLCTELSKLGLAYVHLIEPRFDEIKSENEKLASLGQEVASEEVSLKPFRAALGSTPVIAAGGYNADNADEGLAAGEHDLIAMGRYFCSNADLVDRLRTGKPLYRYNRARFYGPFKQNEIGYTVHPEQLGENVPMPLGD